MVEGHLHVDEADLGEVEEDTIVGILLEVVTVEDTAVDQEDMHHTERTYGSRKFWPT